MKRLLALVFVGLVASFALSAEEPKPRATLGDDVGFINCLAFSPDGKTLASGGDDKKIHLWDMAAAKQTAVLEGHTCVAFSPDSKTLATGNDDKTIKLWDAASGKNTATFEGQTKAVESVAFSPDGKTLASGDYEGTRLWDVATGKTTSTLKSYGVTSVVFSPDGKTLALGAYGNKVRLWDPATGTSTILLDRNDEYALPRLAFSPDGKMLAAGGRCVFDVRLFDMTTGKLIATLRGHDSTSIVLVAFTPDGKTLVSAHVHGGVKLWDVATGKETAGISERKFGIEAAALSPDGKTLAVAVIEWDTRRQAIQIWDMEKIKAAAKPPAAERRSGPSGNADTRRRGLDAR